MQAYLKREHEAARFSMEDILNEELRLDRDDRRARTARGQGKRRNRAGDGYGELARIADDQAGHNRGAAGAPPRRFTSRFRDHRQRDVRSDGGGAGAGERIEIRGFGSFGVKERRARQGRNPKTGDVVEVDAKRIPFFRAGKELRVEVNGAADTAQMRSA